MIFEYLLLMLELLNFISDNMIGVKVCQSLCYNKGGHGEFQLIKFLLFVAQLLSELSEKWVALHCCPQLCSSV